MPGWQGGCPVGDRDAPRNRAPVDLGNPVDDQLAHERCEPGHDDVWQVPGFQRHEAWGHKEAGIGSHQADPMSRQQHRQGLRQKFPRPLRRPGMTRP